MTSEWHRDGFTVSTDKARLDVELIHRFLAATYWARGIPAAVVRRAIDHSLCFGLYENAQDGERQVGFARVITDYATFAYLSDVFVLEAYRGRGLGDWLVATILAHPDLQGLRRWSLVTREAHGLYRKHGFTALANPERYMEIADLEVYERAKSSAA
jgi:GNAT superfamily N-acetyltransferase